MLYRLRIPLVVLFLKIIQSWCYPFEATSNYGECTKSTYTGKCIPLRNCSQLFNIFMNLENLPSSYTDMIKDSQCGYNNLESDLLETILVCCPKMAQEADDTENWIDNSSTNEMLEQTIEVDNSHCGVVTRADSGGGQTSDYFPWMALIEYVDIRDKMRRAYFCSGNLINNLYILTAAHCVSDEHWKPHRILLGDWSSETNITCLNYPANNASNNCLPPNTQIVEIENAIAHPKFPKNLYHDIALIRMKRYIEYTKYMRPICLPFSYTLRLTNLTGILTEYISWAQSSNNAVISNRRKKIPLRIWNTEKCQRRYRIMNRKIDLKYEICSGGEQDVDTCNGDSGGALMYYQYHGNIKVAFVVAVMASGPVPCGLQGWPNISIDVRSHLEWILMYLTEP